MAMTACHVKLGCACPSHRVPSLAKSRDSVVPPFSLRLPSWSGSIAASASEVGYRAEFVGTPGCLEPSSLAAAAAPAPHRTFLAELHISNFALVDQQCVRLQPGLNVITGESGSGKSVLILALSQLLGAPAAGDVLRPPADTAVVEGLVHVAPSDVAVVARLLTHLGVPQRAAAESALQGGLRLRREIYDGGASGGGIRSRCYLNGSLTSLRVLREVGRLLVDANGQHAALSMRDATTQLALLDNLAGTAQAAAALAQTWQEVQTARVARRALDALADEDARAARQALVDDVAAAGVEPGEDAALRRRLKQLDARRSAAQRCAIVSAGIGGDGSGHGLLDALHDVELQLRTILSQEERLAAAAEEQGAAAGGGNDGEEEDGAGTSSSGENAAALLRAALEQLASAREALEGSGDHVQQYARRYKFRQADYDVASARLQQLQRLMRQHGAATCQELTEAAAVAEADLDAFFQMEHRREDLEGELAALEGRAAAAAVALAAARRAAAGRLSAGVEGVLQELAMGGSKFEVRMKWTPATGAGDGVDIAQQEASLCGQQGGPYRMHVSGLDVVEFLFAAGPEEPLRPLSSVASGGEAARVMLAIKAAPAAQQPGGGADPGASTSLLQQGAHLEAKSTSAAGNPPILVLDEIDSGVGSRLGQPIGRILRRMSAVAGGGRDLSGAGGAAAPPASAASQVLCVSHLPQVAAHAENHVCVRKAVDGAGRVVTRFESLSTYDARLQEVAAMLGLPEGAAEALMQAAQAGQP